MPKTKLTTQVPLLLVAITAAMLCLRAYFVATGLTAPPLSDQGVVWLSPSKLAELKTAANNKLRLYAFDADWSPAAKTTSRAFGNYAVLTTIQKHFTAIQVSHGDRSVQAADLVSKFNIVEYPTLVTAAADGGVIEVKRGQTTAVELYNFLKLSQVTALQRSGMKQLMLGHFQNAAQELHQYIKATVGEPSAENAIWCLLACQLAGQPDNVQKLLGDAIIDQDEQETEVTANRWPNEVYLYLNGKWTAAQLLNAAKKLDAQTKDQFESGHFKSFAQTAIGLSLLAKKDKAAVDHLKWVVDNAGKESKEYLVCQGLLARQASQSEPAEVKP